MKTAILYTGLPDNFNNNYLSHQSWINTFDADLYIATWDSVNLDKDVLPYIDHNRIVNISLASSKHIKNSIEKQIDKTLNSVEIYKEQLIQCMMGYYTMQLAYRSVALPKQYDMIVRLRFDLNFHPRMNMSPQQIQNDCKLINFIHGWQDRFNYGHANSMGKLMNIFGGYSNWYIGPGRKNIELLFMDYIKDNGMTLNNNFKDFSIVKSPTNVRNQHTVS